VVAPDALRLLAERLLAADPAARPAGGSEVVAVCRAALDAGLPLEPGPDAAAGAPSGTERTVLVVDDSQLVLRILRRILSTNGYRVLTAESPQEALQLVTSHRVDVLLTDMVFPEGETGVDLVSVLRRQAPDLAMVAMSGQIGKETRDHLLGQGVATFLAKPLAPQEVLDAVGRACVGAGRSLLLVDDDRLIRLVLKRLFEGAAFRVRTAASVEEARRAIAEAAPDVIVSDLHIRGESGLTLLQYVRDAGLEVPFIMLSGTPDAESVIAAYRLRVVDFVVKSDDTKQLIRAVEGAVTGRP
jgi:DNA-binding NtrC family response regulator